MSYVDKSLLPDERVTYRTHLHKIIFVWPAVVALFAVTLLLVGSWLAGVGTLLLVAAIISELGIWVRYTTSEFAVTNRRVIIKVGLLSRRTLEMMLSKIEAVAVDQGIGGRIFGYGTITVTGTGGTNEPFKQIAGPLEFRRAVQAATV
jgi:uncharacterized membrane protein YdbT with pleckstrin-like domain